MNEPLRPMSTGQLLDHTFALYRKNLLLFLGIASVGPAANVIFQLLTVGANVATPLAGPQRQAAAGAAFAASMGLSMLAGYIVMLAGMAISHAATVKAVAAVHLGRGISIAGAYKALRGRVWSVFGTFGLILLWLALAVAGIIGVMAPVFVVIGLAGRGSFPRPVAPITGGILALVAAFLVFAAIIAVYVRYGLAIQACVVENLGPRNSLKRSVFLTKGSRWRVVVIYVVFLLLSFILKAGLGAIAGSAGTMLHSQVSAAVLIYTAGFIAGSITGPLATIGLSLLYYDERVRKEAFDLQLMMLSLDSPEVPGMVLEA